MPAPRELPQQIPVTRANARMQTPQGGGKFLVQIPGGTRGDGYGKIDTCIIPPCQTCQGWSHWLGLSHQDQTGIQGIQVETYENLKFLSHRCIKLKSTGPKFK